MIRFFAAKHVPARILLADDDTELASMLEQYLTREGFSVTVVNDGETALRHTLNGQQDVVVLDVMMPRMNGIEALRQIRLSSHVPVLMLTAQGDDIDRILGLELGADDYVPKPCTPRELAARLRAILRRVQTPAAGAALSIGPITISGQNRTIECDGKTVDLTSAEFNILHTLALNAGRIVSKTEMSQEALGRPLTRYDRSIDVHVSSIRQKLGRHAHLIHTVRGLGYQLVKAQDA
jgi:DNA-binding response OmpR family regulator